MNKKLLVGLLLLTIIGSSALFAQQTTLNGVWERASDGRRITVSGNTGVWTAFGSPLAPQDQDAINKGWFKIGEPKWRNLTSTGNRTWSGQDFGIEFDQRTNIALRNQWNNATFTLSADGNTLQTMFGAYTRVAPSIIGVWERANDGRRITVNGNTGVWTAFGSPLAPQDQDAINKGWFKIGEPKWRNLTSTGNLTWSGQDFGIEYDQRTNVALRNLWNNATFTLSADGNTLQTMFGTYTRRQ